MSALPPSTPRSRGSHARPALQGGGSAARTSSARPEARRATHIDQPPRPYGSGVWADHEPSSANDGESAESGSRNGRPARAGYLTYGALLAVLLLVVTLAQTPAGRRALHAAGLRDAPSSYTELAFSNPQDLPRQQPEAVLLGEAPFVIRNATGGSRVYRWSVALSAKGRATRKVAAGQEHLADGAARVVTPEGAIPCEPGPISVRVTLEGTGETLGYHTSCTRAGGGRQG